MTEAGYRPSPFWRWLMKLQNPFMLWLLRSPFHGAVSKFYVVLGFTGRKSGKPYATPVQYAFEDNTVYIVTSEGYVWWKNLRGGANVTLRIRGKDYTGWAETDTGQEAVRMHWEKILPHLPVERREKFVSGRVAIRIMLNPPAN
jgi:deazaflavin-dependent oxidoreductase (nitroreductase family)